MKYVKSYYATEAVIRYYGVGFDRDWPDAPHVAFANLRLDYAALKMFTRRYGTLYHLKEKPKLDAVAIAKGRDPLWAAVEAELSFVPDLKRARLMQELLTNAWRNDQGAITKIEHGIKVLPWFGVTDQVFHLNVPRFKGVNLFAGDMWNFIRAAFLLDYKAGRAKICKSGDCPTPYFLQSRKGQEFCCHKCAVLINVRRFREQRRDRADGKHTTRRRGGRRTK